MPSGVGMSTLPAVSPAASVWMALCAAAAPAASEKPAARLVTTKPRRVSVRGGNRLSNCGSASVMGNLRCVTSGKSPRASACRHP
ncbi:Uncharacterised protein [Bordetella pertussis]|nr:Uncharacterised protein [Bordetella pertussis]